MRLSPRPLVLAVAIAATTTTAGAADLMDAYMLARQSDPQLAAAEAQRYATREGIVQQRAALLPQVDGTASYSETDGESSSTRVISIDPLILAQSTGESDISSRNYSLNLNQSIYDRANYTRVKASRARSEAAGADLDAAVDSLMLRVTEAYFNVLTAIDTVVFARAELRAVGRQLEQADQRFEVGLTAITDVHEARARFDGARATEISALNALDDAREALAEITGEYMVRLQGLSPDFDPQLPTPPDMSAWVDTALANNPVLASRAFALAAASADIDTARAGHLPTLGGSISWSDGATWGDFTSQGNVLPTASDGRDTVIGVTLRVPIFSGFATQSRVRQNVYLRDAAGEQVEAQQRAVVRQTRTAYRALIAGISEIEARRLNVVSASSALEATEAGFEVGTRTIVDVLLSQQLLFQAERDYSTARHNFLVNLLRLKQSAGVIGVDDIKQVNRFLTVDAAEKLERVEEGETPHVPASVEPVEG